MSNFYITNTVEKHLLNETTKISKRALDVLDRNGIAGIVSNGDVFWFESYTFGNNCSKQVYNYLIRFIKRKLNMRYLYDVLIKE